MTKQNFVFNHLSQLEPDRDRQQNDGSAEQVIHLTPPALLYPFHGTTIDTEKVPSVEAANEFLLNTCPDLLIYMDQNGTYLNLVRIDRGRILKDSEQLIGKNIYNVLPKKIAQERMQYVKRALLTGKTQVYEHKLEVNGNFRYEEVSVVPHNNAEVIAMIRDITTCKQVEEKLLRSEANLRLVERVAQMGSWELDVETQSMIWSEEMLRILGYTTSDIEPTLADYVQHIHPDDEMRWQEAMGQALIEGKPYELDFRILRLDESVRHVAATCEVVMDAESRVSHLFGTVLDISERKRAEELLRSQTRREQLRATITERIRQSLNLNEILQTAVNEIRDFLKTDRTLIYRFDADWSGEVAVESVGENCLSLLGVNIQDECFQETHVPLYSQGRIRSISDIYNANLSSCHIELLARYQVQANLVVPIMKSQKLWGLLIAHHCRSPRKWNVDEIHLLQQLTVQMDIALQQAELYQQLQSELEERKQIEAALRQSEFRFRKQALQLEKTLTELQKTQMHLIQSEKMSSLGQLVAGVAHEINNPINFIFGNLNYVEEYAQDMVALLLMYQSEYPQPLAKLQAAIAHQDIEYVIADLNKILNSMRNGTERIREIVQSLRTFSRLDEAEFKAVNVHAGIESTLMILSHRLKPKPGNPAIQLIKNYGNLPTVECYPGQLNQVFMNLLSNAIDALEEKIKHERENANATTQTLPTIQIHTKLMGTKTIAIHISDNGLGIPSAIRHRIFDPFFTTKPIGKGTGMGLAISYQIVVDKHQGKLKVNTELGKGTEFIVEIPTLQN